MRHVLVGLFALVACLTTQLSAQGKTGGGGIQPMCVSGCQPTVSVTPDGGSVEVLANSGSHTATFFVTNTSSTSGSYSLTCSAVKVTCGTVNPSSVTVPANGTIDVDVSFTVGSRAGSVTLTASGSATDTGDYSVVLVSPVAPTVALRNQNGDNLDRGLCLTSGAGEAAAMQCGDLLVAHGTPGYATMGRERSLTLLYSSAQAVPRPLVAATVTQPTGSATPATLLAELKINSGSGYVTMASASYTGWGPGAQASRQVAIAYTDTTSPSGLYPFQLTVTNQYPGTYASTVSGTLILINRAASPLGRGWSLAGVEELRLNQPVGTSTGDILWIGGDGSAKRYTKLNSTTWIAPPGAFRDTLTYNTATLEYTSALRHSIKVTFDAQGRHIRTANRVGQQTIFAYDAQGRLTTVSVPPSGVGGTTYSLAYDATGNLDRVTDPAGRVLDASVVGGRLSTLIDPDGRSVQYAYDVAGRMQLRTNRQGYTTRYEYSNGVRLTKVNEPFGGGSQPLDTARTEYQAWDEQGLGVGMGQAGLAAVDTGAVVTKVLGPRPNVPDDATFRIDRWGAPTKITDALGQITVVSRGSSAFPALVTRVLRPSGLVDTMWYDGRSNLLEARDSIPFSSGPAWVPTTATRYTYGDANTPDGPTLVRDAIGRQIQYTYNALGLTQSTLDAGGLQTDLAYTMTGSLIGTLQSTTERQITVWRQTDSLEVPLDRVTTFAYDSLGNVVRATGPSGVTTAYVRDVNTNVQDLFDPLGTQTHFTYDALNRTMAITKYRDSQGLPYGLTKLQGCLSAHFVCGDSTRPSPQLPTTLTTNFFQGAEAIDSVKDPRGVNRGYVYDRRGSVAGETDDYGQTKRAYLNAAGLTDSIRLRNGDVIRMAYDTLGRRKSLWYPAKVSGCGFDPPPFPYPGDVHCSERYHTVPGDSLSYVYDNMGHLVESRNRAGDYVRRSYFANGALRSQVSQFASLAGSWDSLAYRYDGAGARTLMEHAKSATIIDSVRYVYNGSSGNLDSMTVKWGTGVQSAYTATRAFAFVWDKLGKRRQVTYPSVTGGMTVTYAYDLSGSLRRLVSNHPGQPLDNMDRLDFTLTTVLVDPTGNVLKQDLVCNAFNVAGSPCGDLGTKSTSNAYDRMGSLVRQQVGTVIDSLRYDASGNMMWHRANQLFPADSFYVATGHNRLERVIRDTMIGGQMDTTANILYTLDGARFSETTHPANYRDRYFYYDAMGRQSGVLNWVTFNGIFSVYDQPNACRYDPDGQLSIPCDSNSPWLRFDGPNVVTTWLADRWHFVHGPAVDDPLVGLLRHVNGTNIELYFVTDGNGRQFSVADKDGYFDSQLSDVSGNFGWQSAGGTKYSYSFGADRMTSAKLPGLSFFRNRVYDQATGRWTQEDPIGLAGGINLYQFNHNNPVAYTDPFGLAPDTVLAIGADAKTVVTACKGVPECKRQFNKLDRSSSYVEYHHGPLNASCKSEKIQVSCSDPAPVPGHGPGGTITYDKNDPAPVRPDLKGRPNTPVSIFAHELSHFNGCADEPCAQKVETLTNDQVEEKK